MAGCEIGQQKGLAAVTASPFLCCLRQSPPYWPATARGPWQGDHVRRGRSTPASPLARICAARTNRLAGSLRAMRSTSGASFTATSAAAIMVMSVGFFMVRLPSERPAHTLAKRQDNKYPASWFRRWCVGHAVPACSRAALTYPTISLDRFQTSLIQTGQSATPKWNFWLL